jgi:hypothetical protein
MMPPSGRKWRRVMEVRMRKLRVIGFSDGGPLGPWDPSRLVDAPRLCKSAHEHRERRLFESILNDRAPLRFAALRPCGLAALRPCGLAALRPCGLAALRPCGLHIKRPNPVALSTRGSCNTGSIASMRSSLRTSCSVIPRLSSSFGRKPAM